MEEIRISAKTLDEAKTQALLKLNTSSDHIEFKVVEEGSSGLLGFIGSKPWVISARVKSDDEIAADAAKAEADKKAEEAAKAEAAKKAEEAAKAEAAKKAEEAAKAEAAKKAEEAAKAEAAKKAEEAAKAEATKKAEEAAKAEAAKKAGEAAKAEAGKKADDEGAAGDAGKNAADKSDDGSKADDAVAAGASDKNDQDADDAAGHEADKEELVPVSDEEAAELMAKGEEFLKSIFAVMDITAEIKAEFDHGTNEIYYEFNGDDMGILIGKRGQTLDSLQYLVSLVVNKHRNGYIRVKLDTENYRDRRKAKLEDLAHNIAQKVKRTRRKVELEPMNPYERRIIHSALQNDPYVTTTSEGEEPYRHVVVLLKKDQNRRRYNGSSRDGGSRGYGDRNHGGRRNYNSRGGKNGSGSDGASTEN